MMYKVYGFQCISEPFCKSTDADADKAIFIKTATDRKIKKPCTGIARSIRFLACITNQVGGSLTNLFMGDMAI